MSTAYVARADHQHGAPPTDTQLCSHRCKLPAVTNSETVSRLPSRPYLYDSINLPLKACGVPHVLHAHAS
jgi:hypothetical protein